MNALKRVTLDGVVDLVERAVKWLRTYEPIALDMHPNGYYVAYSGGKDSDVIRILCQLAGVKHELWHNHTTVDAPETVYYVRSIPGINISYPRMSMWKLIVHKGIPPTRIIRYCCEELKEHGGEDRFVVTGVRKSESLKRSNRDGVEIVTKNLKNKVMLNADNDKSRRIIETCITKGKRVLNPIIDWEDNDVWDFLHYQGCDSNPLYECGFKRIGCIGCPIAGHKREKEFVLYPEYKDMYIRTFERMIQKNPKKWKSGEEVFDWWMSDEKQTQPLEGQLSLFDIGNAHDNPDLLEGE